jgi:DNA helicase HerA-like ATPase
VRDSRALSSSRSSICRAIFGAATLVILDEAHIYCPKRDSGEAEATGAVSLTSQGRKRGCADVIATQRLSKLHKMPRPRPTT